MVGGLPTERPAGALIDAVHAEADDASDDMAVCIFSTDGRAQGDGGRVEEVEADLMTVDGGSLERFLGACGLRAEEKLSTISAARGVLADSATAMVRIAVDHRAVSAEVEATRAPALAA